MESHWLQKHIQAFIGNESICNFSNACSKWKKEKGENGK